MGQRGRRGVDPPSRVPLDRADPLDHGVHARRHLLVHGLGVGPFDEVRLVAVADEKALQLLAADPSEHGRIGDLVAVQVQDRQNGAVGGRVEELVGVPGGRERAGLGLAVAHDARDDEIGIVERGPIRV